jgi:23S rRNA pseudouridine2605 synthase
MNDDARPDANPSEPESAETESAAAEETLEAATADTEEQAADGEPESIDAESDDAVEAEQIEEPVDAGPAPKLERLQKILARAGIASRRHAEELMTEGRVQVNGKVVTELGTKADEARDHIRVDGKLLQGSERLRYYMLNKPKGFVTTVSDPEGRPTVMQFFAKSRERLYPVGRLDYLSEGLLIMTNDGELANKLTRAASGVEKTYLVKVSGEPTEEELDHLREGGVGIDREKPGSGRVHTAPAQIRKVRQGDNPWYEVVLIEGRNRELRKMFEEIGHHVEKIRRVGYGPLVLDVEPGKTRELEAEELEDLRKAADGKLRKTKSKDKRRDASQAQLPTLKPRQSRPFPTPPAAERPASPPRRDFPPKREFGSGRPPRPDRPAGEGFRPRPERSARPERPASGPARFGSQRPERPQFGKPGSDRPQFAADRPAWKKEDRTSRPPARFGSRPSAPSRFGQKPPLEGRPSGEFQAQARPAGKRPFEKKQPWKREGDRPAFKPRSGPRHDDDQKGESFKPPRTPRLHIEAVEPGQETPFRPSSGRPSAGRPPAGLPPFRNAGPDRRPSSRPSPGRPGQDRPGQDRSSRSRPSSPRPSFHRTSESRPPSSSGRTVRRDFGPGRPPRAEGDRSRPFTTSTGKPRPGGARPSNKRSGPSSTGKPAWKPKPGGAGRPASGRSKPAFGAGARPGGSSRSGSGFKGKPGGRKPGGSPRPGGKRPGGKPGGKKRG